MGRDEKALVIRIQNKFEKLFGIQSDNRPAVAFEIAAASRQRGDKLVQSRQGREQDDMVQAPDLAATFVDTRDFGTQDETDGR